MSRNVNSALIGKAGCGKSSLFNKITGHEVPAHAADESLTLGA